jgi:hypothetical protein
MYPSVNYHPAKSDTHCRPSPTWSHKAHDKWASRQCRALTAIHEILKPTHWATIKLNQYFGTDTVRRFQGVVSKAIEYRNKQEGQHIAIYAAHEINEGGIIHYHVLIRASNIDPDKFLNGVISKFNRKNGTVINMKFIEPPESSDAVTLYTFKLGKHDTLLFSPGSLSRYTFTAGRYFMKFRIDDLSRQSLDNWLLWRMEKQVDNIVGDW